MSEILYFTDIHIDSHKSKIKRLEDCLEALTWVFQTAVDRNIKSVVFLGDLFQNRQKINTLAYFKTFQIFESYNQLSVTVLLGNHDMWFHDKWDVNSIAPFGSLPHVTIVAEPLTLTVEGLSIDFLPYTRNPIEVLKQFTNKSPILCGHVAIDDAQLNKIYDTRSEVSVEIEKDMVKVTTDCFNGWERVFLGHYHGEQKLNERVEYVGSPLQLNFNEAGQKKHVAILDTETLHVSYVENTFSPKHIVVNFSELESVELNNNFVIVESDKTNQSDLLEMRKDILNTQHVESLEIRETKEWKEKIDFADLQSRFDIAKGDVLIKYVEAIGCGDLDKSFLMEFGREVCQSEI